MVQLLLGMNPIGQIIIGLILVVFIMTLVSLIRVRSKYEALIIDLSDAENRKNKVFQYGINNGITSDFRSAIDLRVTDINTPAIIDKNIESYLARTLIAERFIGKSSGLMIVLGLVGTFFGLTLSISELVTLLSNTSDVLIGDVGTITGGLLSAINGMSVAFITSLFGITASILVNILTILLGSTEARVYYASVAEEYLDNVLGRKSTDLTYVDEDGRTPLEAAFEALGDRLSNNLQSVSEAMSYRLTVASNSMKDTAGVIEESLKHFDQSVQTFSQNTRDFSEFNHHLKSNIQRMSVAFDDLTENLKETRASEENAAKETE
ncbi:MAG: hypothetical protein PWQ12_358 [Clostridiales bacterium]|jgi:hypothetical protein|nr:hypothetical protein [Clostridiales bacterium]